MKKLFVLIFSIFLLIGCTNNNSEDKIYLESRYYNMDDFNPIDKDTLNSQLDNKDTFLLFTYNNYCNLPVACEGIFEEFMDKNNIGIDSIAYKYYKETTLHEKVVYAPSVIIIKDGEVVDYLDANSDDDFDKYQNTREFTKWISSYINLNEE